MIRRRAILNIFETKVRPMFKNERIDGSGDADFLTMEHMVSMQRSESSFLTCDTDRSTWMFCFVEFGSDGEVKREVGTEVEADTASALIQAANGPRTSVVTGVCEHKDTKGW